MAKRPLDPQAIAIWRYQLIQEALDETLTRHERGRLLTRLSRAPLSWPGGGTKRVSRATLYRWLQAYRRAGLQGLCPKARKDKGVVRQPLPEQVVARALALLREDPTQSLTFLLAVLQAEFRPYGIRVPRTTLSRRLRAQPEYAQLVRAGRQKRRRRRFSANASHEIWQTDAKGDFPVRLRGRREISSPVSRRQCRPW